MDPGQRQYESDVFISHSSCDTDVAREMKSELEKEKLKVFIYEDDLPGGAHIHSAIADAIYGSKRCVLMLSEDILRSKYFDSEYSWAKDRQNELGVVSCIPVLYKIEIADIPAEFRNVIDANCLRYGEGGPEFYRQLIDAIRQNISIKSQITVTHTGVGLAWSYFYGYLDIILPGLEQRVNEKRGDFDCRVFPKFIIILPVSCRCPVEMPSDEKFNYKGFIEYKVSRAGNKDRCYKSTVYEFEFKDREEKQVHCYLMMEFATPLMSLFQMCEGKVAKLTKPMMTNERHTFKKVIEEILVSEKMARKYLLVDYRDEDEETSSNTWGRETVGEAVARAVENDMIKDGCTGEFLYPV